MITISAMPNTKHTAWTVAAFHDEGSTSYYHLAGQMPRPEAEALAAAVRAVLGLKPPTPGSIHDYSETLLSPTVVQGKVSASAPPLYRNSPTVRLSGAADEPQKNDPSAPPTGLDHYKAALASARQAREHALKAMSAIGFDGHSSLSGQLGSSVTHGLHLLAQACDRLQPAEML